MDILNLILIALWFILPAYSANSFPILFSKIFKGKFPMDFGKTWRGKPIFGSNKTWPGFFGGILVGAIIGLLQSKFILGLLLNSSNISIPAYHIFLQGRPIFAGLLLGIGALTGDLVKSFVKRRAGIAPGKSWPIIDQLDFIIGALLFVSIVEVPTLETVIIVLILTPVIHLAANTTAYLLKIKKVWY